jgi:hypothetical protein
VTPEDHRATAEQLLRDVDQTEVPSEARVLTQSAIAHALLGLLEVQISQLPRVHEVSAANCGECGNQIVLAADLEGGHWIHTESGRVECYRDLKDTETAYPERTSTHG